MDQFDMFRYDMKHSQNGLVVPFTPNVLHFSVIGQVVLGKMPGVYLLPPHGTFFLLACRADQTKTNKIVLRGWKN